MAERRQTSFPNLWFGWPQGRPHPTRGRHAPWAGQWGDFRDGRSALSQLARKIEKELRERFAVRDPATAVLVRQAARQAAMSEALADQLFDGTLEAQRRTQERYTSAVRGYRKALDLLETSAGRATGQKPTLAEVIRRRPSA